MNRRRGFTVVELIIVITVMAILLIVAVVNLRSTQIAGRDEERKTDVENIARAFEGSYGSRDTITSAAIGTYPGTTEVTNETTLRSLIPDLQTKDVRGPDIDLSAPMSLVAATNTTTTAAGVTPQPTKDTYVYQPIRTNGSLCTTHGSGTGAQECRRFFLYYRTESTDQVQQLKSIRQ